MTRRRTFRSRLGVFLRDTVHVVWIISTLVLLAYYIRLGFTLAASTASIQPNAIAFLIFLYFVPLAIFLSSIYLIFIVRRRNQVAYGVAEIIFGVIGLSQIIQQKGIFFFGPILAAGLATYGGDPEIVETASEGATLDTIYFQLGAILYIGVRGADNLSLGLRARREARIAENSNSSERLDDTSKTS